MATTAAAAAKDASQYEGGAGGKFRKRPFRRTQTTPYDRPPTALRNLTAVTSNSNSNNSNNGWLSKLVDPASRLITASAHRLFGSVFRKRLPPPLPPPSLPRQPVPEATKESTDKFHQASSTENMLLENPPGSQQQNINEGENPSNNSDSSGFTELEQILKQKTFTRSEIDRLTSLLHSRTPGMPAPYAENRFEPKSALAAHNSDKPAKSAMQENGIQSHKLHGISSTPVISSRVVEEDVASPSELAKAYMGSRSSKLSPSMLGLRSQAFREGGSPLLSNAPFTPKSPHMSLVTNVGVTENGGMTPRSRGRSAIYSMARTPYSRIRPASSHKGPLTNFDAFGGPSSSSHSRLEGSKLSSSKQVAQKRGSYVLDNDIGSIGPIRRIRQKPNLLSSKSLSLPFSGSPLSGTGVISKMQTQNGDNVFPTASFASIPSQSSEMAQKILQQLDKLAPSKDKSSELKLAIAREESPAMLTSDMLSGQARRSLEDVDLSRFLENVRDNKFDGSPKTSLPDARGSTSQKQDKVEENGPTKVMDHTDRSAPVNGVEATVLKKDSTPMTKSADSAVTNPAGHPPPQKKRAFQMSAHEDYLDLDDDIYTNGTASNSLAEEGQNLDTSLMASKSSFGETMKVERPPISSEGKTPANSINKNADPVIFKGTALAEKSTIFTFPVAPATSMTILPAVVPSLGTNPEMNQIQPKETIHAPSIINFGSNNVDKVSQVEFSSTLIVGEHESKCIKPGGASSDPKLESSSSSVFVAVGEDDATFKVSEPDKVDKSTQKAGDIFRKSEAAFSSAASTSSTSFSSFGFPPINYNSVNNGSFSSNGSLSTSPSTISSPAAVSNFNNVSTQNLSNSSTVVASILTATSTASIDPATTVASGSSNLYTSTALPSFAAAAISSFGSSVSPLTSVSPVPSGIESTDSQVKQKQETSFGNLSSNLFGANSTIASTGSSIFGFSASATTTPVINQSLGSNPFGTTNKSLASAQASVGTGAANFTQSTPVQFGSSSAPTFGLSGATAVASGSSHFGSSTPASSANIFSSGASFGLSYSASSSEANSISSSNGPTSSVFSSSWQSTKSPIFGSTSNPTSSTVFSFSASPAPVAPLNNTSMVVGPPSGASTGSVFSFTPSAAKTPSSNSLTPSQPVFGHLNPAFSFGSASGNKDQMNMEDTMAEDTIQASTPSVPHFGQPPISSPSPGFGFNSITQSGANPFQFGGQQNPATIQNPSQAALGTNPFQFGNPSQATLGANPFQFGSQQSSAAPQNQSPFQGSGSLEFNAGGSFSLGTGGGDKSNRKMVKVRRNPRKK